MIAEDAAGNLGPASNEASATVTADTTPPTVTPHRARQRRHRHRHRHPHRHRLRQRCRRRRHRSRSTAPTRRREDTERPLHRPWDEPPAPPNGRHTTHRRRRATRPTTRRPADPDRRHHRQHRTPPPPTGLVAAYALRRGQRHDGGDASGNGNAGTVTGATWSTRAASAGALSFDGVNDLVIVPDAASLDLTTGMTLEAWVCRRRRIGVADGALQARAPPTSSTASTRTATPASRTRRSSIGGAAASVDGTTRPAAEHVDAPRRDLRRRRAPALRQRHAGRRRSAAPARSPTSTGPLTIGGNTIWAEWFDGRDRRGPRLQPRAHGRARSRRT